MIEVSASLLVGHVVRENDLAHEVETDLVPVTGMRQMCEGSTSRIARERFQLESLILAQNERWRQA